MPLRGMARPAPETKMLPTVVPDACGAKATFNVMLCPAPKVKGNVGPVVKPTTSTRPATMAPSRRARDFDFPILQAHEPAKQQVVVQLFHQQTFTAHRVQRL